MFNLKSKIKGIPTDNLYIALIGYIKNDPFSNDFKIKKVEYVHYFTAVKKEDRYIDLYNNCKYDIRDEEKRYTILKIISYQGDKSLVTMEEINETVKFYNYLLEDEIQKKGDNQIFVRKLTK